MFEDSEDTDFSDALEEPSEVQSDSQMQSRTEWKDENIVVEKSLMLALASKDVGNEYVFHLFLDLTSKRSAQLLS